MTKEHIGLISGLLVFIGFVPYTIRVLQGKITHDNVTSWFLWSAIGFALLVTYDAAGAEDNIWPAWGVFLDPLIIAIILIAKRKGKLERPKRMEWICIVCCAIALAGFCYCKVDGSKSHELAAYSLYLAIVADTFAAVPIIIEAWKDPLHDRPFAWIMLVAGYFLDLFALPDTRPESYLLPVYICILYSALTLPLIIRRIELRYPLKQWI